MLKIGSKSGVKERKGVMDLPRTALLLTGESPFDLPNERETGFAVNPIPDSMIEYILRTV